jgi:hypothetical protein
LTYLISYDNLFNEFLGGKMKILKKILFVSGVFVLIISLMIVSKISLQGALACDDLTNCKNGASCAGAGTVNFCTLKCEAGPSINCGFIQ